MLTTCLPHRPLFLLALLSAAFSAQAQIQIELRPTAEVDGAEYRLAEIAQVRGGSPSLQARLEQLVIGRSPKVGHMGYVSRIDLEARIRSVTQGQPGAVRWSGAPIVKVRTRGHEVSTDAVVAAADSAIRNWLNDGIGEAQMRRLGTIDGVRVPSGRVELDGYLPDSAQLRSKMCVWVDVSVAGRHYQTVPVWFEVSAMRPVYRVTKDLPPGHALQPDDLTLSQADIAAVTGQVWPVDAGLQEQRTTRWVAADSVVTRDAVEALPAVIKGQRVSVAASAGSVTLKVSAVALEDGNVNDVIPVTRRTRDDAFRVRVTDKAQAVVADETAEHN